VLVKLAKKNGLKPGPNKSFFHEDPLRTARFELIGRPPAFIFGFSGFKTNYRQLQESLELWIEHRHNDGIETPMKALPAVIASQGSFAWRNAAPLALSNREMLGVGSDPAPVRLIVLQMLYLLNRRLNVTSDGYGLKPSLNAYLSQFSAPKFEVGVGDIDAKVSQAIPDRDTMRFESAKDHTPKIVEPAPAPVLPAEITASPEPAPPVAAVPEPDAQAAVFDKPSPFASAPVPPAPQPEPEPMRSPAPVSPLGSAPIPIRSEPPSTPLGSAPIPPMAAPAPVVEAKPATAPIESAPIPAAKPAAAEVMPNKPPVDFDLGGDNTVLEDKPEPAVDDFINTVVIPPNAGLSKKETSNNTTDAFIARVKEQLSTSEPAAKNQQDPFSSTVPQ
jgi:hypothetical protein